MSERSVLGVTKECEGDIGNRAGIGDAISGVGLGEISSRSYRESYRNIVGTKPESEGGRVRSVFGM